jgi:PD-(D/E)XK nuclease superfamily protein
MTYGVRLGMGSEGDFCEQDFHGQGDAGRSARATQDRATLDLDTQDIDTRDIDTAATSTENSEIIPWIMAVAEEPEESWASRRKRNPKRLGEIAEAAFLLKAAGLGLGIAKPWGDSERFDFIVWAGRKGRMRRVQVKSSGRLYGRGYEVQPVYSVAGKGKVEYTAEDIDVLAAYVRGLNIWYVLPVGAFAPAKSLRFYPDVAWEGAEWEEYREKWGVLGSRKK